MVQRTGTTGPILKERDFTFAIGVVAAGAVADVSHAADLGLKGIDVVRVDLVGAPYDPALALVGGWNDPATGIVTVRVLAATGGIGAGNLLCRVSQVSNTLA